MLSSNRMRQLLQPALLIASVVGAFAVPLAAARSQLPALVAPATHEYHVGKVIFLELVTPDLAAAERFYGGVFGWTFRDINVGRTAYAEAMLGNEPVAELLRKTLPAGEHLQPAWLTYFAVRDVDAATQTAVQHGAKILFQPHNFPDRGREAVLADPRGAIFAVLASRSGNPPDLLATPGAWIWSSLIARDPEAETAFYQALFNYEVFEVPGEPGAQHFILASEGYARASVNPPPASRPDIYPHWLNYVRVDDATGTAAKVVALGGRVLVEPRLSRGGGKIALVADPLGAPFGLLEWPTTGSEEGD
jgi:predicted enzyme related to lactoylglutathione lyase